MVLEYRTSTGSSPRMRGTQPCGMRGYEVRRFIPAHAGNTLQRPQPRRRKTVHPRACGEHGAVVDGVTPTNGSSPRMRGTRPHSAAERWSRPVHPRACGEHCLDISVSVAHSGSSPRMRGTLDKIVVDFAQPRFIPAHAGNTGERFTQAVNQSVHPRACGEHNTVPHSPQLISGSSPRMRGTPGGLRPQSLRQRFIPAHAGNTHPAGQEQTHPRVHPRACGEHIEAASATIVIAGSSPRMRGTHH